METKNEDIKDLREIYSLLHNSITGKSSTAYPVIHPDFIVNIITKVYGKKYTESEAKKLLENIIAEYPDVDEERIKRILKVFIVFDKEN